MKYAVLADLHLGSRRHKPEVVAEMQRLRAEGYTLVLAGDIFDFWLDEDALKTYGHVLRPEDILLKGNHDHALHGFDRSCTLTVAGRRIFITHGDEVDFIHGFAMLERARRFNEGPWWVRLLAKLKPFTAASAFDLYAAIERMPDWAVRSLEHGGSSPLKRFWALTIGVAFLNAGFWRRPDAAVLPEMDTEVITTNQRKLLHRMHTLSGASQHADVIIMGHLHRPLDRVIPVFGRSTQRLIVVGSWVQGQPTTYVLIEEDGRVLVRPFTKASHAEPSP